MKKKVAIICDLIDEEQKTGIGNYETDFVRRLVRSYPDEFDLVFVHQEENALTAGYDNVIPPKWIRSLPPKFHFIVARLYRYGLVPIILWLKRVSIVHNMNYASFVFADWMPGHSKLVTLYDFIPLMDPSYAAYALERTLAQFWLDHSLKKADAIVSISHFSAQQAKSFGIDETKVAVAHLGLIRDVSSPDARKIPKWLSGMESARYVLGVSSIAPHKNIESLVDAFLLLKGRSPEYADLRLVFAGKNRSFPDSLRAKIENDPSIVFTGFVSNAELDWLYANAFAFVLPSKVEWFGLPILEAMANGCPVIASNASSIPEVVWTAWLLIDPNAPSEIADAIESFIRTPSLRDEYIARWFAQEKSFDMDSHVQSIASFYRTL